MATLEQVQAMFKEAADLGYRIMVEEEGNSKRHVERLETEWQPVYEKALRARKASGFSKHTDKCR